MKKLEAHEATNAWIAVVRAYNLCSKAIAKRIEPTGLNLLEHEVLMNLLLAPGLSQQQLAARCFSAKSGISAIVSKLEDQRILERLPSEDDARKKLLFLTENGRKQAIENFQIQNEIIDTMASVYTPVELADLEVSMTSMGERLKERYL